MDTLNSKPGKNGYNPARLPDKVIDFIKSKFKYASINDIAYATGLEPEDIRLLVKRERRKFKKENGFDTRGFERVSREDLKSEFDGNPSQIFNKFFTRKDGQKWSSAEDEFLEMSLGERSLQEIADLLGRTMAATQKRYERLGLDFRDTGLHYTIRDVSAVTRIPEHEIINHVVKGRLHSTENSGYKMKSHTFKMLKARHRLYDKFKKPKDVKCSKIMACFRNAGYKTRLFTEASIRIFMLAHAKKQETSCIFCDEKVVGDIVCKTCVSRSV